MGRIMAIDYGQKRVGLAVTDELQLIATGLETVHVKDLFHRLQRYVDEHEVERFVVGEPKTLMNQKSDAARFVDPFVKKLKKQFPHIPVSRMDERFTSVMAHQAMRDAGLGKKARQNKELVDTISATMILQSWLSLNSKP
ncbi:MAG: Holliday junction resolvase RuvX [Bacteroidetes bacterium]|nr:MAG: Holliday junction resolvase RuvX [Bacteroidota bacterium]